jgi:hypothetical protein
MPAADIENMNSNASFQVVYDGPAVEQGEMDVRDLAPALMSLGWLIEDANHRINGDERPVSVRFKAVEKGSLIVNLALDVSLWQTFTGLFTSPESSAVEQLLSIVTGVGTVAGAVGGSIFWAIKKLRGRNIESVTPGSNNTVYVLLQGDNATVQLNRIAFDMAQDPRVRMEASKVIKPLEKEGVEEFYLQTGGIAPDPEQKITKEDLPFFLNEERPDQVEDVSVVLLQLIHPDLTDANSKWRFTDGNGRFNASIGDTAFLQQVQSRTLLFGHGDAIRAELVRRQAMRGSQLRTEYEIRRVLNYYSGGIPPAQQALPL